jgi:hypothetical protein
MKKDFIIPVTVSAFTKEEAQANVDLLLQMGAFFKDYNINNLSGSFITRFVVAKLSKMAYKPTSIVDDIALKSASNSNFIPSNILRRKRQAFQPKTN